MPALSYADINPGDQVYLAIGGPLMSVNRVVPSGPDEGIYCQWIGKGGNPVAVVYRPHQLLKYS